MLATLDAVLERLGAGGSSAKGAITLSEAGRVIDERTVQLLGGRRRPSAGVSAFANARIMVTLPTEASRSRSLVRRLLRAGMSCARINTAHDDARAWEAMCRNVRAEAWRAGVACPIMMDLAGPKLRTGPFEPGPRVVKIKPVRDALGRVTARGEVTFRDELSRAVVGPGEVPVGGRWLGTLRVGTIVRLIDTRGRARELRVQRVTRPARGGRRVVASLDRTAYIATGTVLRASDPGAVRRAAERTTVVGELPPIEQAILVRVGDVVRVSRRAGVGRSADGRRPAVLSCTLPEAFGHVRPGEGVWIDDGKIGARVRRVRSDHVELLIERAPEGGAKIRADKGINLPDTTLPISGLSPADLAALPMIARHAQVVAMSFVRAPEDIADLRRRLVSLGGRDVGIVLKIETRQAFDALPRLLLEALRAPAAGVMIARGDLAVEVGYERLAEVQEEILWLCEAAHLPVIWATQVLETMAKTGRPSRAEVTDAAMAERAECVMLNKGPHIVETVRFLDDLMRRMQQHQSKKRATMRALGVARRF